jgi:hypothetical protein
MLADPYLDWLVLISTAPDPETVGVLGDDELSVKVVL